jgi:predicted metalloprotease with PDZ domain
MPVPSTTSASVLFRLWTIVLLGLSQLAAQDAFSTQLASDPDLNPPLRYRFSMPEPWTQYLHVTVDLEGEAVTGSRDTLMVEMASWTPGSYKIRDYAGQVPGLFARTGEGRELEVRKVDKRRWAIALDGAASVRLRYRVWCYEHSVRTPYINTEHASLIPAGVLIYPSMYAGPSSVTVEPYEAWHSMHCGLERHPEDPWTLLAPNRDLLLDAPIEIGTQEELRFEAAGIPHTIAITGEHNADLFELQEDIAAIVEASTAIFGHNPNPHYTFLVQNTPNSYGGLEHLNSTSMVYGRWNYASESGWLRFMGLVSHEYFHLWNVKRVRPAGLGPFDYSCEVYTHGHWITEGFTSYYDDLILRRAGIMAPSRYLRVAAGNINSAFNRPGDSIQPVADASFDAWIKYYASNANSNNTTVSYYTKGAVLAMYLDIYILAASKGKRRLDDVMRILYERHRKDPSRGYTEAEFVELLSKVAGEDMQWFMDRHVHGTERVDLASAFKAIGAKLVDDTDPDGVLKLGLSTNANAEVRYVLDGHPAYEAGIMPGDEILAVDGWRFDGDWQRHLDRASASNMLTVTVNRNGKLREIPVALFLSKRVDYRIVADEEAGNKEQALYRQWLSMEDE